MKLTTTVNQTQGRPKRMSPRLGGTTTGHNQLRTGQHPGGKRPGRRERG